MIKIVIFGTGKYYRNRASEMKNMKQVQICAFIDNNSDLRDNKIEGLPVFPPEDLPQIDYDYVVLMSIYAEDMRRQLLAQGINKSKILFWKQFRARISHGTINIIPEKTIALTQKKKVLIIAIDLNYDGSSLAAVYAANTLRKIGYEVIIAAPTGNRVFIEEYVKEDVTFAICPALPYLYEEEIEWIKKFDIVIVNTFLMIQCACEIRKIRPVIWWIHEVCEAYKGVPAEFGKYMETEAVNNMNVLAVSSMAGNNFNKVFPCGVSEIMPFGIPDEYDGQVVKKSREKLVFAIIGTICSRKAQIEFIKAIARFTKAEIINTEFWVIGRSVNDDYYEKVKILASDNTQIKILGEKTREELRILFQDIDVVVCASLEETMSITMVEGMMYGKICITTEATGIAEYIQDGKNGYICATGDSKSLYEVMKRVKEHYGQLESVKEEARQTYEKYFTLERFAEQLEREILLTERMYL